MYFNIIGSINYHISLMLNKIFHIQILLNVSTCTAQHSIAQDHALNSAMTMHLKPLKYMTAYNEG